MFITLGRFAKNLKKKRLLITECFRFVFFFLLFFGAHVTRLTGRLNDKTLMNAAEQKNKNKKRTAVMMSSGG